MSDSTSVKKPSVPWDVSAFEKLLAALIKTNPIINLKPGDIAQYYNDHSTKAISHRLTMAKNVAEAMTVGGDLDAVVREARDVMNGNKRKHSDIGGEGQPEAPKKQKKSARKTL